MLSHVCFRLVSVSRFSFFFFFCFLFAFMHIVLDISAFLFLFLLVFDSLLFLFPPFDSGLIVCYSWFSFVAIFLCFFFGYVFPCLIVLCFSKSLFFLFDMVHFMFLSNGVCTFSFYIRFFFCFGPFVYVSRVVIPFPCSVVTCP